MSKKIYSWFDEYCFWQMCTGKLCILDMGIWAYGAHCNDSSAFRALPPNSVCWWSTKSTRIIAVCSVCPNTHVQYTQTDTIRQTDGPLVPMVRLVPIENDVIPMVLLVNVHLIKGTTWMGTGQFRWSIGTIGTNCNRKWCHSNGWYQWRPFLSPLTPIE